MTEKNNEIDVFESLAETMMFCAEDGEKMREDILKIRKQGSVYGKKMQQSGCWQ